MKSKMHKVTPLNHGMLMGPYQQSLKPVYPTLHLSETDLPEVKDWKVGKDYYVMMKLTQVGSRKMQAGQIDGEFEIKEVGVEKNDKA